jgi:hypothetical protein
MNNVYILTFQTKLLYPVRGSLSEFLKTKLKFLSEVHNASQYFILNRICYNDDLNQSALTLFHRPK